MNQEQLERIIQKKKDIFENVADQIWGFAELKYEEYQSAALQKEVMKKEGFQIEENLGQIPTAFRAVYGTGHPVIGILGEFDALPNLSQIADITEQKPVKQGAPGHGCGHHLLGAGCMLAAAAVKEYIDANELSGTVIYYGCPAEEGGAGKAFMVRAGCFRDCDVCLAWHPYSASFASVSTLASARILYDFYGKASHAASAPHLGRSALDAVELMNVGVNYLREHMIPEARVHYAVTDSGGNAPNVVQAHAQVHYSVRAPRNDQLFELVERVHNIARGAALMTETKVQIRIVSAYADVLQNRTLDDLIYKYIQKILPLSYTDEEMAYAEKFHAIGDPEDWKGYQAMAKMTLGEQGAEYFHGAVADVCLPPMKLKGAGSTDVGDVSWNVPSAWFGSACFALGTAAHTWLAVAQGKSAIAHRGMDAAAEILAAATLELLENPVYVTQAKADFEKAKEGASYQSLIPEDVEPGSF